MEKTSELSQTRKEAFASEIKKVRRVVARLKRRVLSRHLLLARALLVLGTFFVLLFSVMLLRHFVYSTGVGEYVQMANSFLFKPDRLLESREGRVNILLLGLAGDGVKNPVLSDTIMVLSVPVNGRGGVKMISVPRDIWVPALSDKINSAYFQGNEKREGGGIVLARSSVEEVIGFPIQYTLAIDFDGFVEIIDILGGIEVDVERGFTDSRFPIVGLEDDDCEGDVEFNCRYETLTFEKGVQTMDGQTALKFARSRHSEDLEEGTDLARAARQQKVLVAVRDKISSPSTLLSPRKLLRLVDKFWEIAETDMSKNQMAFVGRLLYDARGNVSSATIPEGLLFNPPYSDEYDNMYVFIPASEDKSWRGVHDWAAGVLAGD